MPNPESLLRLVEIGKTTAMLGSDWHFLAPTINQENSPARVADRVINDADQLSSGERHLYCVGDIYDAAVPGSNNGLYVQEVLDHLSRRFDAVFFVPGNHDLRGRPDPF